MPPENQNQIPQNPLDGAHQGKPIRLLVLTAVMLIIGGLSIWYLSCQKDRIPEVVQNENFIASSTLKFSDWQTYRNEEYGFEFNYSKELFLYESGSKIRLDTENLSYEGDNLSDITIFIIPKKKDGIEYWKNKVVKDLKVEEITIGGLIAHKVSGMFDNVFGFLDEIPYQVIILDRGGDTIEISNEISESNTLYINKILSTFKFISTSTESSTGTSGDAIKGSGMRGTVTIGPTCPVMREPPDPGCADKPFEASLLIKNEAGKVVLEAKTNKDGTFKFDLPPGKYTIENASRVVMPSLSPIAVTVNLNTYSEISLQFDSGIR